MQQVQWKSLENIEKQRVGTIKKGPQPSPIDSDFITLKIKT